VTSWYEQYSDGPHLEVMACDDGVLGIELNVRSDDRDAPMRSLRSDRTTDRVADVIDTDDQLCRV
jgi:hypothetical protein